MAMDEHAQTGNDQEQVKTGEEEVDAWWGILRWSPSNHGWVAKKGELTIFVAERTYEEHLTRYLVEQGVERKTWSEIMRAAADEWQRQCEVVERLQKNLDYWLNSGDRGVWVYPHAKRRKADHIHDF